MLFPIAIFAPLLGAVIAGLFGRVIGDRAAQAVTITLMVVAACCGVTSWVALITGATHHGVDPVGSWVVAGSFHVDWALRYDALSVTMVAMVTFIATLIHVYSVGYMGHEERPVYRFFSYLSVFSFAMLMLVSANNLLQLFFGWEGVGLASYLLIGYWYDKPTACAAAIKAFVVNRIADLFFAVGIAMIFAVFGSLDFDTIFAALPAHVHDMYALFGVHPVFEFIALLLFIGAMGKSAQIGLHVWLPDAMEGPTPVSALIHAATMVTAGVFLMARMSPLMAYADDVMAFIAVTGGTTALFAATIGCAQTDIKRVIAYSTCSQLGYMFVAAGVGAFQVSIFHLITHAFFKALLFLSAGSVIHAVHGEQDMRKMGGLWRHIPVTYVVMWIGSLALAGIPPFAGYYSKDAILEAAYAAGTQAGSYGFWCGVLAALLTAFYSWRLLLMTFHGRAHVSPGHQRPGDEKGAHGIPVAAHEAGDVMQAHDALAGYAPAHDAADPHAHEAHDVVHESPPVMLLPLIVLALGAIGAGYLLKPWFIGVHRDAYWNGAIVNGAGNHVMEAMEHVPVWVGYAPLAVGLLGIFLAYLMYSLQPGLPARLAATFGPIHRLLLNKWYVDEIYGAIFVRPYRALSRVLWQVGDSKLIDGVPNGLAALTSGGTAQVVRLQTGSISVYAFTMLIGLVVLISTFLLFR
jgi:NADH-quinone oxidoreductase subunit L